MLANHDNFVSIPSTLISTSEDLNNFREFWYANSKESCQAMLEFQKVFLTFVEKQMISHKNLKAENKVYSH